MMMLMNKLLSSKICKYTDRSVFIVKHSTIASIFQKHFPGDIVEIKVICIEISKISLI